MAKLKSRSKALGSLIVKGFRSGAKRPRRIIRNATKRKTKRAQSFIVATATAPMGQKSLATIPVQRTVSIQSLPEPIPPVRSAKVLPIAAESNHLTADEMVRPHDKLQKSIEAFLLDQRSEHTRRAYGKDLKRFVKFLVARIADRKMANTHAMPELLTRGLVISYKDSLLSEKLEHTTVDRHLSTLRSFFRWLVEDEILEKNPAENVRFLNPKRVSSTQGMSDDEVVKILKKPDLHRKVGSLHYAVLMVLFYCGLRRSELCDLRTSNLAIEKGHRFLRLRGKGNAERIVILIDPVWHAIEHYFGMVRKDLRHDQPLFTPVRNNRTHVVSKPIDPSMVFYVVRKYAKLAGVQHRVSPHSCRATAISNARDHQVPDRAIQEFAGWTTPNMITRYDKRKSALEKSAAHSISYGGSARDLPARQVLDPNQLRKK